MKNATLLLSCLFLIQITHAQPIGSNDWLIKTALLAAPEAFRAEATVLGLDESGMALTLREGTNSMICLADDPNKEGFSAAAYHKDLEPFMARGRELKSQGMGFKEIFDTREEEVKSGKLPMPERAILYVFAGNVNAETGEIENRYTRYVVYIPFATSESTGLAEREAAPGIPWIMDPGTHRAHIMITPPR